MNGVTRGLSTVAGAALAGILLWFATQLGTETAGEYWSTYGLVAAAGLALALSQILGGWTKGGWPRFSLGVFGLAFLPALVAAGWVLLARQPADWLNTSNWSRDLGVDGLVADLGNILPALAFGLGLIFGFSFDTAGPREAIVTEHVEHETRRDEDEPLTAEGPYGRPETATVGPLADDEERPHDDRITATREERQDR